MDQGILEKQKDNNNLETFVEGPSVEGNVQPSAPEGVVEEIASEKLEVVPSVVGDESSERDDTSPIKISVGFPVVRGKGGEVPLDSSNSDSWLNEKFAKDKISVS